MTDDAFTAPGLTVQEGPVGNMDARLQGTLAVDKATNCLVVLKAGNPVDVAWPRGWSVAIRDRSIALIDAAGQTVAKLGDALTLTGGYVPPAAAHTTSCTGHEKVFAACEMSSR